MCYPRGEICGMKSVSIQMTEREDLFLGRGRQAVEKNLNLRTFNVT